MCACTGGKSNKGVLFVASCKRDKLLCILHGYPPAKLDCWAGTGFLREFYSMLNEASYFLQAPTVLERVKDAIEPDIGIATIVNDGSIYLALSTWYVSGTSSTVI